MTQKRHNSLTTKKGLLIFKILIICALFCSCSGDIEYKPVSEALTNEELGQNVAVAILDFPDKRPRVTTFNPKPKSNLVGIFRGYYTSISFPLRNLYSDQAVTLDVIDAIANSFEANGFDVIRYHGISDSSLPDERLAVKGQINEFLIEGVPSWRGVSPSMVATIDIDLMIIDTKYQRTIWTGKIENYRRMDPTRGLFTRTSKIFLFLNAVFSDAIEKAWIDYGMLDTLRNLNKKPFSQ